jgi:hypothetical protein
MTMMERHAARGTPSRSDVRFCRVAALAALSGALLVPAALLTGYNLFVVQGTSDRLPLALVASVIAAGIALMITGTRVAARVHAGADSPDPLADSGPIDRRRSMA